jgi:hypothetical protein
VDRIVRDEQDANFPYRGLQAFRRWTAEIRGIISPQGAPLRIISMTERRYAFWFSAWTVPTAFDSKNPRHVFDPTFRICVQTFSIRIDATKSSRIGWTHKI